MKITKKILLLEDRPGRQSQFLNKKQIDFLTQIENLIMPQADECVSTINKINEKKAKLDEFNLIIIHRSSLSQSGFDFLKQLQKDLILFSGGLSQIIYKNEGFPVLSVNSADLYNEHFIDFIKKYIDGDINNLTELIYGDKWKLGVLLQYKMIETKMEKEDDNYYKMELEEQLKSLKSSLKNFPVDINKEIDKQILAI